MQLQRVKYRWLVPGILFVLTVVFGNFAELRGEILFQTNFDNLPDWSSPTGSYGVSGLASTHASASQIGFSGYRDAHRDGVPLFMIRDNYGRNGTKGLRKRFRLTPRDSWSGGSLDIHFDDTDNFSNLPKTAFDELYIRFYQKWDSSWSWGDGSKTYQIKMGRLLSNVDYSAVYQANGSLSSASKTSAEGGGARCAYILLTWSNMYHMYYPEYRPTSTCLTDGDSDSSARWANLITPGQWHCIEYHVKMNDLGQSNLIVDLYIDGELVGRLETPVRLRDSSATLFNTVILFDNHQVNNSSSFDQYYYIDDLVISTTYVGPGDVVAQDPTPEIDFMQVSK